MKFLLNDQNNNVQQFRRNIWKQVGVEEMKISATNEWTNKSIKYRNNGWLNSGIHMDQQPMWICSTVESNDISKIRWTHIHRKRENYRFI